MAIGQVQDAILDAPAVFLGIDGFLGAEQEDVAAHFHLVRQVHGDEGVGLLAAVFHLVSQRLDDLGELGNGGNP